MIQKTRFVHVEGYESRRMAIDYSIPLVTNSHAKLLIEALLETSLWTSPTTMLKTLTTRLSGLVNMSFCAFFEDFEATTKASLRQDSPTMRFLLQNHRGLHQDSGSLLEAIESPENVLTDFQCPLLACKAPEEAFSRTNAGGFVLAIFNDFANSSVGYFVALLPHGPRVQPLSPMPRPLIWLQSCRWPHCIPFAQSTSPEFLRKRT